MTNQDFCLFVHNNINIKGICYRIGIRRDIEDMEQVVYEVIMKTPNHKINDVYNKRYTLTWVWKVIFNNLDHGEWMDLENIKIEMKDFDEEDLTYDFEKEDRLLFIEKEFRSISNKQIARMNYKEQQEFIGKELLKNKIKKNWTLDEMRDKFKVGRNTMNDIIQNTKKDMRKKYEK